MTARVQLDVSVDAQATQPSDVLPTPSRATTANRSVTVLPVNAGIDLDDERFVAASEAVRRLRSRLRPREAVHFLRNESRQSAQSLIFLRQMPRLVLPVTDSPQGQLIAERVRSREFGLRTHALAQSVLTVPGDLSAYLDGQQRRGLRNKLSKAQRFGVVTTVESVEAGLLADKIIRHERRQAGFLLEDDWPVPAHQLSWLVAYGPDEAPVAVMSVIQDDQVALVKSFHGLTETPLGSPARHALHHHLLGLLPAAGVRYLVGDSALMAAPGVQQFVHQLGYQAWHLRVVTPADH